MQSVVCADCSVFYIGMLSVDNLSVILHRLSNGEIFEDECYSLSLNGVLTNSA
jgi:hypothetical protein